MSEVRIIHLIDKHFTQPYILDRNVSVNFKGRYSELLDSLDKDHKVTIETVFPNNEPSDLADEVLSVHVAKASIRSVLTLAIPKVKFRILWRSYLDDSGVATIEFPASGL